ncbi:VWA domain-containing protein [Rhizobium sp. TH2]|uniref:vWA domain-containing protein n=1 Tax=Rhizobium sp. TH2 TaxID=2775403 RepID=UPI002157454D|nr:TadE/TadG family type IV pilus assembly protein [Rhizobium sp. TH2]UVC06749.1 VWA domain-containing protein [Rhizobium sp. TH2]
MFARAADAFKNGMKTIGSRFVTDRAGNLAMSFAIVSVPLLAAIGATIDYTQLVNSQRHLQDAIDAAAVSSAASLVAGKHTETTVKDYAINFVLAQLGSELTATEQTQLKAAIGVTVTTTGSGTSKNYAIKVTGGYDVKLSPFAQFVGYTTRPVGGVSVTQSQATSKNAMSMYVVLDRSGSMSWVTDTTSSLNSKCQNYFDMDDWKQYPNIQKTSPCYVNKMSAVKTAAAALFDQFDAVEKKDTTDTLVRVGGVSFNDSTQSPQATDWGTTKIRNYVTALPAYPEGGTNMTGGMKQAYDSLTAASETTAQTAKGNTSFSKFIVLMSDGENTGSSGTHKPALDVITLTYCTNAKLAGITIYTVAFMAPTNGEILLRACASTTSNYYAANDMPSLIKAFAEIGDKATQAATRITN